MKKLYSILATTILTLSLVAIPSTAQALKAPCTIEAYGSNGARGRCATGTYQAGVDCRYYIGSSQYVYSKTYGAAQSKGTWSYAKCMTGWERYGYSLRDK